MQSTLPAGNFIDSQLQEIGYSLLLMRISTLIYFKKLCHCTLYRMCCWFVVNRLMDFTSLKIKCNRPLSQQYKTHTSWSDQNNRVSLDELSNRMDSSNPPVSSPPHTLQKSWFVHSRTVQGVASNTVSAMHISIPEWISDHSILDTMIVSQLLIMQSIKDPLFFLWYRNWPKTTIFHQIQNWIARLVAGNKIQNVNK